MAKIEINKTELVLPRKYNEDGALRVNLRWQVIETVDESRVKREAREKLEEGLRILARIIARKVMSEQRAL